jgi:hypothetical protein
MKEKSLRLYNSRNKSSKEKTRECRDWKVRMIMIWRMMMDVERRDMNSYVFLFLTTRD